MSPAGPLYVSARFFPKRGVPDFHFRISENIPKMECRVSENNFENGFGGGGEGGYYWPPPVNKERPNTTRPTQRHHWES